MRLKYVLKNVVAGIGVELFHFILGMFVPRMIIVKFGSTVNGLTTTIMNILDVINLIQIGAVGASIYEMYKPIADNDYKTVSNILYSSRKYFYKLAIIFSILVICISPFVANFQKNNTLHFWEIELSMLLLGTNGLFSFLFFSWFDILYCSFQKKYYLDYAMLVYYIVYYSCIVIVLFVPEIHFIFLYISSIFGNSFRLLFLCIVYKKEYKKLLPVSKKKEYLIKNRYTLLLQQLSLQGINALVPIFLSFQGLMYVSVFSVYNIIQCVGFTIISIVLNSIVAVFGNVVNTENTKKIKSVYSLIHLYCYLLGIWMVICISFLIMPFIALYTKNITDIDYYRISFAYPVILYISSTTIYVPVYLLINVNGLFKNTSKYYGIGLVASIILAISLGRVNCIFILLMPTVLYLIVNIGIYIVLYKEKNSEYLTLKVTVKRIFMFSILLISSCKILGSSFIICLTWKEWILKAFLTAILSFFILLIYCLIAEKESVILAKRYINIILIGKK